MRITNKTTIDLCEMEYKLCQLENLEEKLGVDLIRFLNELNFILSNCNDTTGYTTDNKKITADYSCVIEFLEKLKEALKNEQ